MNGWTEFRRKDARIFLDYCRLLGIFTRHSTAQTSLPTYTLNWHVVTSRVFTDRYVLARARTRRCFAYLFERCHTLFYSLIFKHVANISTADKANTNRMYSDFFQSEGSSVQELQKNINE